MTRLSVMSARQPPPQAGREAGFEKTINAGLGSIKREPLALRSFFRYLKMSGKGLLDAARERRRGGQYITDGIQTPSGSS